MSDEFEEVKTQEVELSTVEAQDSALVSNQIKTARAYPRNLTRVRSTINAIVILDKDTASSCGYSVPRGGKNVSGPSVHLAKIVAQSYGNIRVDSKVVNIGENTITCQATAWDLETNYAIRSEVIRKITDKNGKRFNEDMIILTGNAGSSIALRNAVFSVVPKPIWQGGYDAAQRFIVGDISDEDKLNKRRKEVLDAMIGTYGIKESDVLKVLGLNSIMQIKGEELKVLIGIGQAIKDGDTTVDQTFFPDKEKSEEARKASQDAVARIKDKANSAQQ